MSSRHTRTDPACVLHRDPRTFIGKWLHDNARGIPCLTCIQAAARAYNRGWQAATERGVATTEEDLDALPSGSLTSLPNGFPVHRRADGNWYIGGHRYPLTTEELWDNTPTSERMFTVLREGGQR